MRHTVLIATLAVLALTTSVANGHPFYEKVEMSPRRILAEKNVDIGECSIWKGGKKPASFGPPGQTVSQNIDAFLDALNKPCVLGNLDQILLLAAGFAQSWGYSQTADIIQHLRSEEDFIYNCTAQEIETFSILDGQFNQAYKNTPCNKYGRKGASFKREKFEGKSGKTSCAAKLSSLPNLKKNGKCDDCTRGIGGAISGLFKKNYYAECEYYKPLYADYGDSKCETCYPMCFRLQSPQVSYDYLIESGLMKNMLDHVLFIKKVYSQCISPALKRVTQQFAKEQGKAITPLQQAEQLALDQVMPRIGNATTKFLTNLIGAVPLQVLRTVITAGKVVVHVVQVADYFGKEDWYNVGYQIGHITVDIFDQIQGQTTIPLPGGQSFTFIDLNVEDIDQKILKAPALPSREANLRSTRALQSAATNTTPFSFNQMFSGYRRLDPLSVNGIAAFHKFIDSFQFQVDKSYYNASINLTKCLLDLPENKTTLHNKTDEILKILEKIKNEYVEVDVESVKRIIKEDFTRLNQIFIDFGKNNTCGKQAVHADAIKFVEKTQELLKSGGLDLHVQIKRVLNRTQMLNSASARDSIATARLLQTTQSTNSTGSQFEQYMRNSSLLKKYNNTIRSNVKINGASSLNDMFFMMKTYYSTISKAQESGRFKNNESNHWDSLGTAVAGANLQIQLADEAAKSEDRKTEETPILSDDVKKVLFGGVVFLVVVIAVLGVMAGCKRKEIQQIQGQSKTSNSVPHQNFNESQEMHDFEHSNEKVEMQEIHM